MDESNQKIIEILNTYEKMGTPTEYRIDPDTYKEQSSTLLKQTMPVLTKPVKYKSGVDEIFVVSDLHIAGGRNVAGVNEGTENFFADESFGRFIKYAKRIKRTTNAILIINGDIFDFLRITDYPGKVKDARLSKRIKHRLKLDPLPKKKLKAREEILQEYTEWMYELKKVGIDKTTDILEASISKNETRFGLCTDDYKTIYKMMKIKKGHPVFFESLAAWIIEGNKLIVVKGNHDVELVLPRVRSYFRYLMAEEISALKGKGILDTLIGILPKITFIDDAVEIDEDFFVEHGHRFDKYTMILDGPLLDKPAGQVNIPFGSFFNRYLINRIELFYPFIDNVRPAGNILSMLIKENFPLAVKVMFQHLPFILRLSKINFRYFKFMFNRIFWIFIAFGLPLAAALIINLALVTNIISFINNSTGILKFVLGKVMGIGSLVMSYLLSRFVAWFQIEEPSSLERYALLRFKDTKYRFMTMGHTHNPGEYLFGNDKRFYNSGTWIPVIETASAEVRADKTYTFLHFERDSEGRLHAGENGLLQRWNDDASRSDVQIIVQRK